MSLDTAQQEKLTDWLKVKCAHLHCAACHTCTDKWMPGELITAPDTALGAGEVGQPTPMVQLICQNCGYVMLFAARPIGLVT